VSAQLQTSKSRLKEACIVLTVSAAAIGAAHAQSSQSTEDLPPVVVDGSQPKKKAVKAKAAPSQAQPVQTSTQEPEPIEPLAAESGEPNESAPGLNLSTAGATGSRLGLTPLETPASVDVISGETARERGQHSIVDAVTQNAPGFSSVAIPVLGSAFASRGFQGNNSVTRLYDGTRLYPGTGGTTTYPFSMWSVERIEVLHGPASVLYGDGAIGGIVNVIPKKPITKGMFNEAEIFFDSNMTRRASLDSGGALTKDVSYRLNIGADASDGWVDHGDSENLGISGVLRWQASPDVVFTISHDYADQEPMTYYGVPYRNGVLDKRTKDKNYNIGNAFAEFEDRWTQFKTEWRVNEALSVRNVAYYLESRREFRNSEDYSWNGAQIDRSRPLHILQDQDQVGNRFDATLRTTFFGMGSETVVGFEVNRANFARSSGGPPTGVGAPSVDPYNPVPGAVPTTLVPQHKSELEQKSFFVEDRLSLNPYLSLVGGVRWDSSNVARDDLVSPAGSFEDDFSSFNWRVGAVVTPVKGLAFFGQYSVASDPLDRPLLDYLKSTADFDLTRGRQLEIGVKHTLFDGALEWSLAGYDIVKKDLTILTPMFETVQIGQQSSRGIEAAIGFELGAGWRVDANGALLKAEYDEFNYIDFNDPAFFVDYAGKVPILVPERTANIWVTWAFAPRWQASAGLQYVGSAFENFANTVERPSYTVTNIGLQWQPTDAATLDFRIKNLFDKTYAAYYRADPLSSDDSTIQGWIAPPRTFEAAMRVRF
jgi:iron complex outermembrane receptor protein